MGCGGSQRHRPKAGFKWCGGPLAGGRLLQASHPGGDEVSEPAGADEEPGAEAAGAEADADAKGSSRSVGGKVVAKPNQAAVANQSSARFWRSGVGSQAIVATAAEAAEATARTATARAVAVTHQQLHHDHRGQCDGGNAAALVFTGDYISGCISAAYRFA